MISSVVLEMGIYLTILDVLFVLLTGSFENIVTKVTNVTMVMLSMHTITFYKPLKAFLAMIIYSIMFVMRCMYYILEKWSTKMIAALHILLMNFLLSSAVNPTCMLNIWSVDTHLPGLNLRDRFAITLGLFCPPCFFSWPLSTCWGEMLGDLIQFCQWEQPVKLPHMLFGPPLHWMVTCDQK